MKTLNKSILLIGIYLLSSCDKDNEAEIVDAVEKVEYADDAYWLETQGMIDPEWDKVILVFGFVDDYTNCDDIAEYFTNSYGGNYRCTKVN
jgi:hypothetical protein